MNLSWIAGVLGSKQDKRKFPHSQGRRIKLVCSFFLKNTFSEHLSRNFEHCNHCWRFAFKEQTARGRSEGKYYMLTTMMQTDVSQAIITTMSLIERVQKDYPAKEVRTESLLVKVTCCQGKETGERIRDDQEKFKGEHISTTH